VRKTVITDNKVFPNLLKLLQFILYFEHKNSIAIAGDSNFIQQTYTLKKS